MLARADDRVGGDLALLLGGTGGGLVRAIEQVSEPCPD
jgi:hypothetical protein